MKTGFKSAMFGILNDSGTLWSHETFFTEAEAEKYLRGHDLNKHCDLSKHKVVPVNVTINLSK